MRFVFFFLFLIGLMAFFGVGRALYEDDNTQNIYNFTNQIEWNSSLFQIEPINDSSIENMTQPEINTIRIKNLIYKFADTAGYIIFEVGKWGMEFGFNHPEWNYLFTMNLIMFAVICMIIGALTMPVVVLIVAVYFIVKEVIKFIKNRKDQPKNKNKRRQNK